MKIKKIITMFALFFSLYISNSAYWFNDIIWTNESVNSTIPNMSKWTNSMWIWNIYWKFEISWLPSDANVSLVSEISKAQTVWDQTMEDETNIYRLWRWTWNSSYQHISIMNKKTGIVQDVNLWMNWWTDSYWVIWTWTYSNYIYIFTSSKAIKLNKNWTIESTIAIVSETSNWFYSISNIVNGKIYLAYNNNILNYIDLDNFTYNSVTNNGFWSWISSIQIMWAYNNNLYICWANKIKVVSTSTNTIMSSDLDDLTFWNRHDCKNWIFYLTSWMIWNKIYFMMASWTDVLKIHSVNLDTIFNWNFSDITKVSNIQIEPSIITHLNNSIFFVEKNTYVPVLFNWTSLNYIYDKYWIKIQDMEQPSTRKKERMENGDNLYYLTDYEFYTINKNTFVWDKMDRINGTTIYSKYREWFLAYVSSTSNTVSMFNKVWTTISILYIQPISNNKNFSFITSNSNQYLFFTTYDWYANILPSFTIPFMKISMNTPNGDILNGDSTYILDQSNKNLKNSIYWPLTFGTSENFKLSMNEYLWWIVLPNEYKSWYQEKWITQDVVSNTNQYVGIDYLNPISLDKTQVANWFLKGYNVSARFPFNSYSWKDNSSQFNDIYWRWNLQNTWFMSNSLWTSEWIKVWKIVDKYGTWSWETVGYLEYPCWNLICKDVYCSSIWLSLWNDNVPNWEKGKECNYSTQNWIQHDQCQYCKSDNTIWYLEDCSPTNITPSCWNDIKEQWEECDGVQTALWYNCNNSCVKTINIPESLSITCSWILPQNSTLNGSEWVWTYSYSTTPQLCSFSCNSWYSWDWNSCLSENWDNVIESNPDITTDIQKNLSGTGEIYTYSWTTNGDSIIIQWGTWNVCINGRCQSFSNDGIIIPLPNQQNDISIIWNNETIIDFVRIWNVVEIEYYTDWRVIEDREGKIWILKMFYNWNKWIFNLILEKFWFNILKE